MNGSSSILRSRMSIILLFFITTLPSLHGQSMWTVGQTRKEVSVEFLSLGFNSDNFIDDMSGYSMYITGRLPFGEHNAFMLMLPYAHGEYPTYTTWLFTVNGQNHSTIGNVYLGVELVKPETGMTTNIGLFLPTIDKEKWTAIISGLFSDIDRYESYIPEFVSIAFRTGKHFNPDGGLGLRLRAGITGMLNTASQSNGGDSFEAMMVYAAQPTITAGAVQIVAGFSGRMMLTDGADLEDRVLHQAGIAGTVTLGPVRFGAYYRLPINDMLKTFMKSSVGGNVTLTF
ncbi:MAG: hypothetical protein F9K22_05800 [Bacteroidetes bacterium]|nr:MAG: hypothetical protein F9K22_05800 [Bacteroidota bacterium]